MRRPNFEGPWAKIIISKILNVLRSGNSNASIISYRIVMRETAIVRYLRYLVRVNVIHVADWNMGQPVYQIGAGKNIQNPYRLPRKVSFTTKEREHNRNLVGCRDALVTALFGR